MTEIILMRGLPGSGKSTEARKIAEQEKAVIVSRDELRLQVYGVYHKQGMDENLISELEMGMVKAALNAGVKVVVDAQHLYQRYVNRWQKLGYPVRIVEVHETWEELMYRNNVREKNVDRDYLRRQWDKFTCKDGSLIPVKLSPEDFLIDYKYRRNEYKVQAFVFDLDGTLAHNDGHRSFYDYTKTRQDKAHQHVVEVAQALSKDYHILIVSGREDSCRDDSIGWLTDHEIDFTQIYMRKTGDLRPDSRVKMEILRDQIAPEYDVLATFDDRPSVVKAWQKMGVPTFALGDQGKEF